MWRLTGYLQEVDACENQTTGGLLRVKVLTYLRFVLFWREFLHTLFKLWYWWFHFVAKSCLYILSILACKANIKIRPCTSGCLWEVQNNEKILLYNCHLKEWLQWHTRSSNCRSSLTVNSLAFWDWWLPVEAGLYYCLWQLLFWKLSLVMKHAWMGASLFWPREGVDLD